MSPWEKLLAQPHPRGHFVQLYETAESSLTNNVSRYLSEGFKQGDGMILITTPEHFQAFCRGMEELGVGTELLLREHQLVFLDAQDALAQFMAGTEPDWNRFEHSMRSAMRQVRRKSEEAGLRAYGEMVGILWRARKFSAAVRLEQFWNRLLEEQSFSLYCAYAIDLFSRDFHPVALDEILCTHTHLIPASFDGGLLMALDRAMDDVLGNQAENLRALIHADYRPSWAAMSTAEATVLWLRKNLPARAEDVVARARALYQTSSTPGANAPLSG